MSTRLVDQPAIWFPTEMRTVRRYQPTEIKRQRIQFETVAAAVIYATHPAGRVQAERDDRD